MNNPEKGSMRVFMIALVAALIVGGIVYVFSEKSLVAPDTELSSQVVDWQTYTDQKNGFSFRYPSSWQLVEKTETRNNVEVKKIYVSNKTFQDQQQYWKLEEGQALLLLTVIPKNDSAAYAEEKMAFDEVEKNATLGAQPATRDVYEHADNPNPGTPTAIAIAAYNNNDKYEIELIPPTGPSVALFDHILATFAFTK